MFRRWEKYHSIAVWSHYTRYDFPRPFSDGDFYTEIIRNLFIDKENKEVLKIELKYGSSHDGAFRYIKVTPPKIWTKIKEIVNVEEFAQWYGKRYEVNLIKREYRKDDTIITTYSHDDDFTAYTIRILESPEKDFDKNYMEIELQTYSGGRW